MASTDMSRSLNAGLLLGYWTGSSDDQETSILLHIGVQTFAMYSRRDTNHWQWIYWYEGVVERVEGGVQLTVTRRRSKSDAWAPHTASWRVSVPVSPTDANEPLEAELHVAGLGVLWPEHEPTPQLTLPEIQPDGTPQ